MPKRTKYQGIQGVGASSIDSTVLEETGQGTFYGGLKVTESIKNQLMEQEIGNYLHAVRLEDGDYLLKHKLPETGKTEIDGEQKEYSIRKNCNRIMKGIGERIFDGDGNLDLKKACDFAEKLSYMAVNNPEGYKDIVGYENLSGKDQKDFDTFLSTAGGNGIFLELLSSHVEMELKKLYNYQKKLTENNLSDEITEQAIRDSGKDYVQFLNHLKNMSLMDVENEYEFYLPIHCTTSASFHEAFYKDVMRDKHPEGSALQGQRVGLEFPEKDQEGNEAHFPKHAAFGFPVTIDGQTKFMTLETTAPPAGKVFFHPEKGTGGIGIYDNFEAFKEVNEKTNYTKIIDDSDKVNDIFTAKIERDDPPLKIELAFIEKSLDKLKNSKRLFRSNSEKYEAMKASVQRLTQLKERLQDEPENAEQLKNDLQEEYRTLKTVSRDYLDSRKGAKTSEGQKRLEMAEKLYQYADEKLTPREHTNEQEIQSQAEPTNQAEAIPREQEAGTAEVQMEDEMSL